MKRLLLMLVGLMAMASVAAAGCTQTAPPPAPTAAPPKPAATAASAKPAEPTKAPAAAPTKAPEATKPPAAPTAAPAAKKVDFPEKGKTISLLVGFEAGGSTDVGARLLAVALEKVWSGVSVQVVNKPGAAGQIAFTEGVRAKPDGYTAILTNLPTTVMTYLDETRKAIYTRRDFAPVGNHIWDPSALSVRADSPFETFPELVDYARANPGKLKFGTGGAGVAGHLNLVAFEKKAGLKFGYVHYTGNTPAVAGLMGGHVDGIMFSGMLMRPLAEAGELRILAIPDRQRNKFSPDVKTTIEMGYQLLDGNARGVSLPAATPKEIVDIWADGLKKAMETDKDMQAKMDKEGLHQRYLDPKAYSDYWAEIENTVRETMEIIKQK